MATLNKFNVFTFALGAGLHDFVKDSPTQDVNLKVCLVNTAPSATLENYAELTGEVANGAGYTTGGNECTVAEWSQTSGKAKLVLTDPATWTATATMGPFRYIVLWNPALGIDGNLIGYADYGSSLTLQAGETFKVDFDATAGVLTVG